MDTHEVDALSMPTLGEASTVCQRRAAPSHGRWPLRPGDVGPPARRTMLSAEGCGFHPAGRCDLAAVFVPGEHSSYVVSGGGL
jgi:hypothetical protein